MCLVGEARLRLVPLRSEVAARLLEDVPAEERLRHAWLLAPDGRRWMGADAIWHTLYLAPGGWLLRPLRRLPGFHWISDRLYDWVAHRWGPRWGE
ncbi:MAG: DUF393 domain-containing protein [Armatimonadetes bacterium]|nr:DUF393 domain-containing protein [Armatimonadota bacterium]